MEYFDYLRQNMWVDIELFKLTDMRFGETNRTMLKFLKVMDEIEMRSIELLIVTDDRLVFYNKFYEKMPLTSSDKQFNEKLIKGNYFVKEKEGHYRLNPNLKNILAILHNNKSFLISGKPTFSGSPIGTISYNKKSYIKEKSKGKLLSPVNTPAFDCFMMNHSGVFNNNYSLQNKDIHFINYDNKLVISFQYGGGKI